MDEKEMKEKENVQEEAQVTNGVVEIHSDLDPKEDHEEIKGTFPSAKTEIESSSSHKGWSVIFIFVILFVMVGLFPTISKMMSDWKASRSELSATVDPLNPDLKYDVLLCTLNRSHEKGNLIVSQYLYHYNGRLKKTKTITETMGNKKELEKTHSLCQNYMKEIKQYEGLDGTCSLKKSSQINTQIVDYKKLDMELLHRNFEETEGFYPEFSLDESVSSIELLLYGAGYSCSNS